MGLYFRFVAIRFFGVRQTFFIHKTNVNTHTKMYRGKIEAAKSIDNDANNIGNNTLHIHLHVIILILQCC